MTNGQSWRRERALKRLPHRKWLIKPVKGEQVVFQSLVTPAWLRPSRPAYPNRWPSPPRLNQGRPKVERNLRFFQAPRRPRVNHPPAIINSVNMAVLGSGTAAF